MTFNKKIRELVYSKCNGHCAYCGCELQISEMQIDHANSVFLSRIHGNEVDNSFENLMPSCRMCNFYKHESNVEGFRNKLNKILRNSCTKDFVVRLAIRYGLLNIGRWNGKFYFEKVKEVRDDRRGKSNNNVL